MQTLVCNLARSAQKTTCSLYESSGVEENAPVRGQNGSHARQTRKSVATVSQNKIKIGKSDENFVQA
jgi:hypothetical protein